MGRCCCWIKMIHFLPLSFLQFHRNIPLSTSINLCISWGFLLNLYIIFFIKKGKTYIWASNYDGIKTNVEIFKWLRISLFSSCKNLIVCFKDFTLFFRVNSCVVVVERKIEDINVLEGIMVSWFLLYKRRNRIKYKRLGNTNHSRAVPSEMILNWNQF